MSISIYPVSCKRVSLSRCPRWITDAQHVQVSNDDNNTASVLQCCLSRFRIKLAADLKSHLIIFLSSLCHLTRSRNADVFFCSFSLLLTFEAVGHSRLKNVRKSWREGDFSIGPIAAPSFSKLHSFACMETTKSKGHSVKTSKNLSPCDASLCVEAAYSSDSCSPKSSQSDDARCSQQRYLLNASRVLIE